MKKTLSILLLAIVALCTVTPAKAEFRWGPTAGINITNLSFKQDLIQVSQGVGPVLGVQGEMMFPGIGFGIDIGAMYAMQGASLDLGRWEIFRADGYGKERAYLHALQIPVSLRFKWTRLGGIEDWVAPFLFGGPVFNLTIAHGSLKALDYASSIGLQAGMGFEIFRRWQIQGSYTWGVTYSVKAAKLIDYSAREKYWTIRATYFF